MKREDVRNIAIIAHVDHGKTTLVDELVETERCIPRQSGSCRNVSWTPTISSVSAVSLFYPKILPFFIKDTKINIIDTPGHADFGGEVERVLKMVDGVILVVDAFEGPMPQTKFRI